MFDSFQIVFLTYVNRSGSTYLCHLLDNSEEVISCPEAEILVSLFLCNPENKLTDKTLYKLKKAIYTDIKLKHWGFHEEDLGSLNGTITNVECFKYLLDLFRKKNKPEAKTVLFKAEYLVFLYPILMSYNFLWLSIIRDIRAVWYSQSRTINPYTNKAFSKSLFRTANYWNNHVKKAMSNSENKNYKLIIFENLVTNFQKTILEISSFLGISDLNMIGANHVSPYLILPEQKDIHKNIKRTPQKDFINKWALHLDEEEQYILCLVSSKLIKKFTILTCDFSKFNFSGMKKMIIRIKIFFNILMTNIGTLYRNGVKLRFKKI
ncbi:MAG: sulfotransferase [Bacteroidales bacterium]|nr:sulfotransferase [Bacteroidales bacterium]MBN2817825.1 sulfotransferase [Bacteroidales bacterium]